MRNKFWGFLLLLECVAALFASAMSTNNPDGFGFLIASILLLLISVELLIALILLIPWVFRNIVINTFNSDGENKSRYHFGEKKLKVHILVLVLLLVCGIVCLYFLSEAKTESSTTPHRTPAAIKGNISPQVTPNPISNILPQVMPNPFPNINTQEGQQVCSLCHGTGTRTCTQCYGTGRTRTYQAPRYSGIDGSSSGSLYETCTTCRGSGREVCNLCYGTGVY